MGASQRRKGQQGEREFARSLREQGGPFIARNLNQSAVGGADFVTLEPWCIECKRQERMALGAWWVQACEQTPAGYYPALAYRASRQPWRIVVPLDLAVAPLSPHEGTFHDALWATLSIAGFCHLDHRIIRRLAA